MNRRDTLKSLLLGLGAVPLSRAARAAEGAAATLDTGAATRAVATSGTCWITPSETEGPYYFDPALVRQDIREGKTGVLLELELNLVADVSCNPVKNAIVDLWHCDKDGLYSGYNQPGGNTVGQTFLRGTQISNASGIVRFTTIYPGWYPGRATHIHFKVRTASTTFKTSQFAFPEAGNSTVYNSPLYVGRGPNPTNNVNDSIFGALEPQYLTVGLAGDTTNGYTGTFTIGLDESTPARESTWGKVKSLYR